MITPIFYGEINAGKLQIINRPRFQEYLNTLKGDVQVMVKPKGRIRTSKQNSWYWGVAIKLISEQTGHFSAEIHEFLKSEVGSEIKMVIETKKGELIRSIPMSTTRLLTKGFNEYKDRIQLWAIENLDLNIPDPNEVA